MKPKKQQQKQQQPPQQQFMKMQSVYKRKCENFGLITNLTLKQILDKGLDSLKLQTIKLKQIVGPIQIRAFMDAFNDAKYNKIKSIEIWKSKISDQGVRHICKYLQQRDNNIVEILDIIDNQITQLGCQFLGKTFTFPYTHIKILKLDDNLIGNKGIENLSIGLRTNPYLTKLSLKYCGIDENGVKFIQDILANIHSKIRSIKLQGNTLKNQGIYQLLRVVDANQMLEKINIADTGLNLLDFVSKNLYVLDQNQIPQQDAEAEQQDQDNPQKKFQSKQGPNIENVKQVVLPEKINKQQLAKQKVGVLKQISQKQKKQHYKVSKTINQNDKSLSANVLRLLTNIMRQNMLIKKYDLRFNPISQDAAIILFQVIEQNPQIKDVQINNNVDNTLRQNLDTLMRKRTGRLPKGRLGRGKGGKKKKK